MTVIIIISHIPLSVKVLCVCVVYFKYIVPALLIVRFFRITEQSRLEVTSKNQLVHTFMGKGAQMTLFSTLSSSILKNSRDGDSTMSQGRLFQ